MSTCKCIFLCILCMCIYIYTKWISRYIQSNASGMTPSASEEGVGTEGPVRVRVGTGT